MTPRGGKRKGSGRKPGPKGRLRSHRIATSVTEAQHGALKKIARAEGVQLSDLVYDAMMEWLERRDE